MTIGIVLLLLILNFGISIWNAYITGKSWVEAKHAGGWTRFISLMGAMMSALGFTWCYLIIAGFVLYMVKWINSDDLELFFNVGYLIIIPGVLFSGLMITINSWANAYRDRTIGNFGLAGYNSFAQMYNTYNALSGIPEALESVLDSLAGSAKSKDGAKAFGLIILAIVVLCLGIITTAVIINRVAADDEPLPLHG